MFHGGLEWSERDRANFAKRVDYDGWTGCFSRAESGNEPWFFYMTRGFVERCLDTIYEVIDGVGAHARPIIWDDDPRGPRVDGRNAVTSALALHEVNSRVGHRAGASLGASSGSGQWSVGRALEGVVRSCRYSL